MKGRVGAAVLVCMSLASVSLSAEHGLAVSRADNTLDWARAACTGPLVENTVAGIYPSTSGTPALCTNDEVEFGGSEHTVSVNFVQYASAKGANRDISMFPRSIYPVLACSRKTVEGGYTVLAVGTSMFTAKDTDSVVRARAPRVLAALQQFGFQPC